MNRGASNSSRGTGRGPATNTNRLPGPQLSVGSNSMAQAPADPNPPEVDRTQR